MFLILILCYLKSNSCTEIPTDLSTNESIIISFDNQNKEKESFLTKTENQENLQELMGYVQNLNKLYTFIDANKGHPRSEKLKSILDVLKLELTNVKNTLNQANFSEFLKNSIQKINNFNETYLDKSDEDEEITLHDTIEKFLSELEKIDRVVPSLNKINIHFINFIFLRFKLNSLKSQVIKLKKAYSNYLDFLKKNDDNFNSNLNELLTKSKNKFNELKQKYLMISEVELEKLQLILNDNLYDNVSDLYEELIGYYDQEKQLLKCFFINLEEFWKFAGNTLKFIVCSFEV